MIKKDPEILIAEQAKRIDQLERIVRVLERRLAVTEKTTMIVKEGLRVTKDSVQFLASRRDYG